MASFQAWSVALPQQGTVALEPCVTGCFVTVLTDRMVRDKGMEIVFIPKHFSSINQMQQANVCPSYSPISY